MQDGEFQYLVSALRGYVELLGESGVDGLAVNMAVEADKDASPEPKAIERAVSPPASEPQAAPAGPEAIDAIRTALEGCSRCALGAKRTNLVFGVGNPKARLVFVGEAPGRDEDLKGEPFVGEAGQLLAKIIEAMGFTRNDVYICNVLKCRPPDNRNPLPAEIEACRPFLLRQVKAIGPEVIVALGTFAAQALLQTREPISRLRGRFHDYHGVPLMPTFHPAFLLRNPAMKREVWEDMKAVMKKLGIEPPAARRTPEQG